MPPVKRLTWTIGISAAVALMATLFLTLVARPFPGSTVLYLLTVPIPFLTAGLFLLWRHPDNRSAQLLVFGTAGAMAYSALLERVIKDGYAESGAAPWMSWSLVVEALVMMVGLGCLARLIGLFPSGVAVTPGERLFTRLTWLLPVPMAIGLLANEEVLVEPVTYGYLDAFPNPVYLEALGFLGPVTSPVRNLLGAIVLVALVLLYRRYRRAKPAERRQIRWVAFGSAAALGIGIVPFIVAPVVDPNSLLHGQLLLSIGAFALLLIPVTVVLAIEQPEWLSDRVISKSFTYGALSIGIFVIYAVIAAALGLAAGARLPLEIAIVVTAVLAFAFQPARARLQRIADRWVFGDRPSPIEAVTELDHTMDGSDGSHLGERLADTVRRAARLRWVTVELPPEPSVTVGERSGEAAYITHIVSGDEELGVIHCGAGVGGSVRDQDIDLIDALAGQAALVVANARLAARIVHAQEAERRRLERNIHDGAQQELVALVAKLGLARARVKTGNIDEATLIELQKDAGTILKDLRELAQGIHPSVLTDGGLVEAVEDRCSRLPVPVTVDSSPDLRSMRFKDDIEGAAYFFVTEGLANVLKHADATRVRVEMARSNGDLELRVSDDGQGFEPGATQLNGLAGLTDRFAALAGTVSVTVDNRGTTLEGRIPIEAAT